ncbi:MAG: flagellar basal body rod protein FlgC [Gammaproteobacteria bacterium]
MSTIFDIAGSGMAAQSLRLNLVASNLANADSTSGPDGDAYRAQNPVFSTVLQGAQSAAGSGVRVTDVVEDPSPLPMRYDPNHPHANEQGYVEMSNVNTMAEMANMMSASRSYQSNIEIMNTTKQLMLRTLQMGR